MSDILCVRATSGVIRSVCVVGVAVVFSACSPAATPPAVVESILDVPRLDGGKAEPTGGIRFGRSLPKVGARWSVSVEARSVANVTDAQGPQMQVSEYVSKYTVEVLATNGPAPSRVRLLFERNLQRYQRVDKATVIDGKTYVIDEAAPHVRDASGLASPEDETQRVLDVFPDLGTRTQIDQVLPEASMTVGDERPELVGAILRVIHPRAWTLDKGSAVLSRADAEEAVFTIAIDATGQSGLRLDVKGEAHVRLRDARLTSLSLDGTYEQGKRAHGSAAEEPGTFSLRRTVRDL